MTAVLETNKTKIARRVFEIFEFFDDCCDSVTVTDIVRRYGRPQSSTSELLSSLVEMGLLYKDPRTRSYTPTPRIAALGMSVQPKIIRDGGLFNLMDELAMSMNKCVALFGMVGNHVQIFRVAHSGNANADRLLHGTSEALTASAAGLLLLSTFSPDQAAAVLWRMNAEFPPDKKCNLSDTKERIASYRSQRYAIGKLGFVPDQQVVATLLPRSRIKRPLALGIIIPATTLVNAKPLVAAMNQGLANCATVQIDNYYASQEKNFEIAI